MHEHLKDTWNGRAKIMVLLCTSVNVYLKLVGGKLLANFTFVFFFSKKLLLVLTAYIRFENFLHLTKTINNEIKMHECNTYIHMC